MRTRVPLALSATVFLLLGIVGSLQASPDIYVLSTGSSGSGTVSTYSLSGSTLSPNLLTTSGDPLSLCITSDYIYVTLEASGQIDQYTRSGELYSPDLITVSSPTNVVARGSQNLYVGSESTQAVGWYISGGFAVDTDFIAQPSLSWLGLSGTDLYVMSYQPDFNNSVINRYNAVNGIETGFELITIAGDLPGLAALNDTNTFIYFCDAYGTISRYSTSTGAQDPGFTITGLIGAAGLAAYGDNLYVANYTENAIGLYDATTGAVINDRFIEVSAPMDIVVVPEPEVALMAGLGVLVLCVYRRRSRLIAV